MDIVKTLEACITALGGISPRVDQVNTITKPVIDVINALVEVRKQLAEHEEPTEAEE